MESSIDVVSFPVRRLWLALSANRQVTHRSVTVAKTVDCDPSAATVECHNPGPAANTPHHTLKFFPEGLHQ